MFVLIKIVSSLVVTLVPSSTITTKMSARNQGYLAPCPAAPGEVVVLDRGHKHPQEEHEVSRKDLW